VAGEVRLFEHKDFEQTMLRAASHHGLSEQFIEKDYDITEILRIVVAELGEKVVFKGGTSPEQACLNHRSAQRAQAYHEVFHALVGRRGGRSNWAIAFLAARRG
jgi:hypothetical protein